MKDQWKEKTRAGSIVCVICLKGFNSPERLRIQICPKCKKKRHSGRERVTTDPNGSKIK
jgi:ubiquitin C-terminal hydrolase